MLGYVFSSWWYLGCMVERGVGGEGMGGGIDFVNGGRRVGRCTGEHFLDRSGMCACIDKRGEI